MDLITNLQVLIKKNKTISAPEEIFALQIFKQESLWLLYILPFKIFPGFF